MFVKFYVEVSQEPTQTEDFEFETGASHTKDKFEKNFFFFFFLLSFFPSCGKLIFRGLLTDK